eukprot:TRINITY_DN31561_c0_g1_i1.p1 TRINITY_DN31561_c0_g1~~TRINITY_DN31561_c0_g1_i1.p1  ORF type:complete len:1315 (-),score=211.35 TRINITY_DN31561_c0_g1_i1:44-3988(-)
MAVAAPSTESGGRLLGAGGIAREGFVIGEVTTVALSADGTLSAAVDMRGRLHVFNLRQGGTHAVAMRGEASSGTSALCFVRVSRDEIVFVVGKRLRIIDAITLDLVATLPGHESNVHTVSAGGAWAVSHSDDSLMLWNVADWTCSRTMLAPPAGAVAAQLSPTGEALAVLYADRRLAIWETPNNNMNSRNGVEAPLRARELLPPPLAIDGERPVWCQVSVARGCVAIAADVALKSNGFVAVWDTRSAGSPLASKTATKTSDVAKARGPGILETKEPVQRVCVREAGWTGTKCDNASAVLFLTYFDSICVVEAASRCVLFDVDFATRRLLQLDLTSRGATRFLMLFENGALEWCSPDIQGRVASFKSSPDKVTILPRYVVGARGDDGVNGVFGSGDAAAGPGLRPLSAHARRGGFGGALVGTTQSSHGRHQRIRRVRPSRMWPPPSGGASGSGRERSPATESDTTAPSRSDDSTSCGSPETLTSGGATADVAAANSSSCGRATVSGVSESRGAEGRPRLFDADERKMLAFLRRHGAFPHEQRAAAWKHMLQLPRNEAIHFALAKGGVNARASEVARSACVSKKSNGTTSAASSSLLAQTLSDLFAWAPVLADVAYLPVTLMRFIQVFASDRVLAFEACVSFLLNWGTPTLDAFPSFALESLARPRALLLAVDPELVHHLEGSYAASVDDTAEHGNRTEGGAAADAADIRNFALAPLVRGALAKCLPRDAWFALWDHLVTRWREGPALLDLAACAFLRCLRSTILALPRDGPGAQTLDRFFDQTQVLPAARFLEEFYVLRERAQADGWILQSANEASPLVQGAPYPPLFREPHFVLDYLALERSCAREDAEAARLAVEKAAQVHAGIHGAVAVEFEAQAEHAKKLRAERARRELVRPEDARLEAERRQCAWEAAAVRIDRVDAAHGALNAAQGYKRELQQMEATRLADETSRRQRLMAVDAEIQARQQELADAEEHASRQLAHLKRERRAATAAQQLRQDVRTIMIKRDHEEELVRRRRQVDDAAEGARERRKMERRIDQHQAEITAMQREYVAEQLQMEGQERELLQGRVTQARDLRKATRVARLKADKTLQEDTGIQLEALHEAQQQRMRQGCQQRLRQKRRALSEAQRQAQRSVDRQSACSQSATSADEQSRFEERLRRTVEADKKAAAEVDDRLRRVLDDLKLMEIDGNHDQVLLERRKELVENQYNVHPRRSQLRNGDEKDCRESVRAGYMRGREGDYDEEDEDNDEDFYSEDRAPAPAMTTQGRRSRRSGSSAEDSIDGFAQVERWRQPVRSFGRSFSSDGSRTEEEIYM